MSFIYDRVEFVCVSYKESTKVTFKVLVEFVKLVSGVLVVRGCVLFISYGLGVSSVCECECMLCMLIGDSDVLNMICVGCVGGCLCSLATVCCVGVLGGAGLRCFLSLLRLASRSCRICCARLYCSVMVGCSGGCVVLLACVGNGGGCGPICLCRFSRALRCCFSCSSCLVRRFLGVFAVGCGCVICVQGRFWCC